MVDSLLVLIAETARFVAVELKGLKTAYCVVAGDHAKRAFPKSVTLAGDCRKRDGEVRVTFLAALNFSVIFPGFGPNGVCPRGE